jgi:transcriptional regulator GlxA family with amidase domain
MPIECKVSNSATNSIKRVNNDVAAKAGEWLRQFGSSQVVPAAVLSGVYHLHHLEAVQNANLTIFWAHNLAALTGWIESTRPAAAKGKAKGKR